MRSDIIWGITTGSVFALGGVTLMWTAAGNGYWGGVVLVATGILALLISGFALRRHEREEADDFAHSFGGNINGVHRRLTYRSFRSLPDRERTYLLQIQPLQRWFLGETHRRARKSLDFYHTRCGRIVLRWRRLKRLAAVITVEQCVCCGYKVGGWGDQGDSNPRLGTTITGACQLTDGHRHTRGCGARFLSWVERRPPPLTSLERHVFLLLFDDRPVLAWRLSGLGRFFLSVLVGDGRHDFFHRRVDGVLVEMERRRERAEDARDDDRRSHEDR
jgi:hypothetical protein